MNQTDWWTLSVILGLALVTLLTRSFFFISSQEWHLPRWVQRGLQYAPIAALAAVIVPEIVMQQGQLVNTWQDARLFGAAAGIIWYICRRDSGMAVLGTIITGLMVYLPLHIGLGW
jgi:branched-subunit amino acid transport protein